jgi:hypothetical protein
MESNGGAPKLRVDFSIRIVADAPSYTSVGQMMDSLAGVIGDIVEGRGSWDFVGFQMHPCGAARMEDAGQVELYATRPPF